jgi:hypothetical protein
LARKWWYCWGGWDVRMESSVHTQGKSQLIGFSRGVRGGWFFKIDFSFYNNFRFTEKMWRQSRTVSLITDVTVKDIITADVFCFLSQDTIQATTSHLVFKTPSVLPGYNSFLTHLGVNLVDCAHISPNFPSAICPHDSEY